jgi:addiction module HigA family antidote
MSKQHNPPHPGEVLKDGVFTGTDLSIKQFAERLGVTRAALSRVINGRVAISPDMALRLADALGGSAESWLHMQANSHWFPSSGLGTSTGSSSFPNW